MNFTAHARSSCGFTLVELIVAIAISSLLVGIVAMTSTAPVDRYLEQGRRAEAMRAADRVVFRMSDDLQHALPNSIRRERFADIDVLQLLDLHSIAYYQEVPPAPAVNNENFLQIGAGGAGDTFDAYGRFNFTPIWLVVNNQGRPGVADAYERGNVMIQAQVETTPALGPKRATLDAAFFFASASPSNRLFAVRGPVTYVCNRTTGTLTRFENHAVADDIPSTEGDAQLVTGGTIATVMANGLTNCRIECRTVPGTSTCWQAVTLDLQLQRGVAPDDENVRLFRQFVVDNSQ